MRQFSPGSGKHPFDRNPTQVFTGGGGDRLGLQVGVILASYIVPAGRRAMVGWSLSSVVSIALAAGQASSLGVESPPLSRFAGTSHAPAAPLHNRVDQVSGAPIFLGPGAEMDVTITQNAGAGQTTSNVTIMGVEYDA